MPAPRNPRTRLLVDVLECRTTPANLMDDFGSTGEITPADFAVLANDTDDFGASLDDVQVLIGSGPANGTASVNVDGTIRYTPNAGFFGMDVLTYAVNESPDPTQANDDVISTLLNTPVTIDVLSNDVDPQNDPLTPMILTMPGDGMAVVNSDNTITYTPDTDFLGFDSFTYEVDDGNGNTDQATVRVDVRFANPRTLHYIPPRFITNPNGTNGPHANRATQLWINTEVLGGASGTIEFPGTSISPISFMVADGDTYQLDLHPIVSGNPLLGHTTDLNTIQDRGIIVRSDPPAPGARAVPINVQIIQEDSNGQSFLTSKSVEGFGTEFYAGAMFFPDDLEGGGASIISVMALLDNTQVTIERPPGQGWNWRGTGLSTVTVTLNAGETYMVAAPADQGDVVSLTGSRIASNRQVVVSTGTFGSRGAGGAIDNGWDQLVPVERVGTDYVVVRGNSDPDVVEVIATVPNTTVTLSRPGGGTEMQTIAQPGGVARFNLRAAGSSDFAIFSITADQPVYVFQTGGANNDRGENGFALVGPVNPNGQGQYRFRTPIPSGTNPVRVNFVTTDFAAASLEVTREADSAVQPPLGSPQLVPGRPDLRVISYSLPPQDEYRVNATAFSQIQIFSAFDQGGGISYIAPFSSASVQANDDPVNVIQDQPRTFNILNNDVDLEGDPLTVTANSMPTNGTLVDLGGGNFEYTPNLGFSGLDSFTYTTSDGFGAFSNATVTLTVFNIDGTGGPFSLDTATLTVTVQGRPDITSNGGGPTATVSVPENSTAVTTVTATDPEGDPLTFTISGGADAGSFTVDPDTGVLTFAVPPDFENPADTDADNAYEVEVTVSDGRGGFDTQILSVQVTDLQTTLSVADVAVDEGDTGSTDLTFEVVSGSAVLGGFNVDFTTTDGTAIAGSDYAAASGTLSFNGTVGETQTVTVSVTPETALESDETFELILQSLSNDIDLGTPATGIIRNDDFAPVAQDDRISTDEDTPGFGNLFDDNGSGADSDDDGDPLTVTAINGGAGNVGIPIPLPGGGQVVFGSDGSVSVDPQGAYENLGPGDAVTETFTYSVSDGQGGSDTATVSIVITGVNDGPTIPTDGDAAANIVDEGVSAGTPVGITATASDPDGTPTFGLLDDAGGRFQIDPATGVVTVANPSLLDGPDSHPITVQVQDGQGGSTTQVFIIDVVNLPPTALLVNGGPVVEGSTTTVTFTGQSDPANADVAAGFTYSYDFDNNGVFELTNVTSSLVTVPASFLSDGPDVRTVRAVITDKDGGSTERTTDIEVQNAPPVVSVPADANLTFGDRFSDTFSFTDPGDDTWTAVVSINDRPGGTFFINGSAVSKGVDIPLTWDAYHAGINTVTVIVTDDDGGTDTETFTITVTRPTTVYVDDDWSGIPTGNDPDGSGPANYFNPFDNGDGSGLEGGDAFPTIQGAIDALATTGGTIVVADGKYPEAITLPDNVTLVVRDDARVLVDQLSGPGGSTVQLGTDGTLVLGGGILQGPVTGDGSLVKDGAGTLTLSGASDYLGTTTLAGGTLALTGTHGGLGGDVLVTGPDTSLTGGGTGSIDFRSVVLQPGATNVLVSGLDITRPGGVGICVEAGASGRLIDNVLTDNRVGIEVKGGTALVQGNDLSNNAETGLLVRQGGIVDAGQVAAIAPLYGDITGLGVSTGGNRFLGYQPFVPTTTNPVNPGESQAIRNLNTGTARFPRQDPELSNSYARFGPQYGRMDVPAQNNDFGTTEVADIERLVFHDLDNNTQGLVLFANPGGNVDLIGGEVPLTADNPLEPCGPDLGVHMLASDVSPTGGQSSVMRYIVLQFDGFTLLDVFNNYGIDLQKLGEPGYTGSVTVQQVGARYDQINEIYEVVLGFTGPGTEFGGLSDGNYQMDVTDLGGEIGANVNGAPGDVLTFWRFFGDAADTRRGDSLSNRVSDSVDLATFRQSYRSRIGMANYRAYFDFDGDCVIDGFDYREFLKRYRSQLPPL